MDWRERDGNEHYMPAKNNINTPDIFHDCHYS